MKDDEDDELPAVIVCSRLDEMIQPVEDSIIVQCGRCDDPVWLSPDGVQFCEDNVGTELICMRCLGRKAIEGDIEADQLAVLPSENGPLKTWLENNRERMLAIARHMASET